MDLIQKTCEVLNKVNEKWDELPKTAKPAATGVALLIGLFTPKFIVALGVIAFFGQRTAYHLGICEDALNEEEGEEKDSEKADEGTA